MLKKLIWNLRLDAKMHVIWDLNLHIDHNGWNGANLPLRAIITRYL